MDIFSPKNEIMLSCTVTNDAEHVQEMMKSNYIKLSWRDCFKRTLPVGAYIIHNGIRYSLLDEYTPSDVSETEFKYEPEFHHPMMVLGRMPISLKTNNSAGEPILEYDWSITDKPSVILAYLCMRLNDDFGITDAGWGYEIISSFDVVSATCIFSNMDYLSALSEICNKFSSENNTVEYLIDWERRQIYLGVNISIGQPVLLKVGENIQPPSVSASRDSYYNRFIVKGSSRNIFQRSMSGENVSANTCLTLDKTKYPDGYINKVRQGEPILTKVLVYDDIYPSLDLYVYDVRERNRFLLDDEGKKVVDYYSASGEPVYKIYSVWYIRLAYPIFDTDGTTIKEWKDFHATKDLVLDGHTLMAAFVANEKGTHSALSGRDFKMYYHSSERTLPPNTNTGDTGVIIKAGDYEINFNKENEDIIIPTTSNQGLVPWGEQSPTLLCDKVVLYNLAMSDECLVYAQRKLEAQALKDIATFLTDNNNYSFKSNPVEFERANPSLHIGRSVIYEGVNGYKLQTRVVRLVTKLDLPFIQDITVGNGHIKGTTQSLKEEVKSVNDNINILTAVNNSFSDKADAYYRTLQTIIQNFAGIGEEVKTKLSKTSEDIAQKLITFLEGVMIGNEGYRIRPNGDAVLGKITSLVYDAVTQQGFGIEKGNNGYKLSIQDVEVWGKAIFNNLELRKLSYVGGNYSFSPAGSKIAYVKWIGSDGSFTRNADDIRTFRCYIASDDGTTATRNMWEVGDQPRCQEFGIKEGNSHGTSNRSYWRLVVGKSSESVALTDMEGNPIYTDKKFDWIDLSKSDASSSTDDFPQAGDTIVARGHRTDERRQGFIDIKTHGDDAPSIVVYSGVNSYQLNDSNITALFSPKDIRLSAEKLKMLSSNGRLMSFLEMTRNEINLTVDNLGGTNMLHGTAFVNLPPYAGAEDKVRIVENVTIGDDSPKRHLDRNYIKMECLGSSEPKYTGIFYKVDVEPDTDYTVSAWVMTDDISSVDTFSTMELVCLTDGVRGERLPSPYITPTEDGVWQKFVNTIHVPVGIRQIEVNFWIEQNGRLYLSEPQVERGRIATDWSENPSDADARALRAGINLKDGTINLGAENIIIDNGTGTPTAVFRNGKMRSELIDVKKLLAGEIDADNAIINNITLTGFMKKRVFHVTDKNFNEVTFSVEYKGRVSYQVDFTKTGSFIVFDYLPENNVYIVLPSITRNYGAGMIRSKFQQIIPVMELLGASAIIINNTFSNRMYISGCLIGDGVTLDVLDNNRFKHQDDISYYYKDKLMLPGSMVSVECKWDATGSGASGPDDMYIYWDFNFMLANSA